MRLQIGDKVFRAAFVGVLAVLALYFVTLAGSLGHFGGADSYLREIVSPEIMFSIKLSLLTATAASAAAMIVAIPAAYALSRYQFPGKIIVDVVLDLPIFISPIAIGAMLLVFFNTRAGMAVERVHPFVFEISGIVLAQFTIVSALAVRLLKSTFDGIDPRYENVARTLGLSKTQSFFRATLPMSRNGLVAAAVITWARAIGEFGATVTVAGTTPMKTQTLPVAIHMSFANADLGRAAAIIIVLIVIAVASLLLLRIVMGGKLSP